MWELDYKESWVQKNWCFWTVVLEKTLESPLDCKEIQPVYPKGDESWVFIGGTDVEAGFRKGRGTRDQIANIHWIINKATEFQKNIYSFIDYAIAFDCVVHNKVEST